VQKINNCSPITAAQRRNRLANRLLEETPDDYSNGHADKDVDGEPADQQLLDHQLLDLQLFEDGVQPAGRPGPVLPQIPLIVAGQLDEPASRPVRQRKRSRAAIEAEDEPAVQPKPKRMKRTG
jgi:hypothetical protein